MASCPRRVPVRPARPAPPLRRPLFAWGLLAAWGLGGCVVAPLPPPAAVVVQPDGDAVVLAPVAPPPLVAEPVLVAPGPGYVWIGGYWSWTGNHHVWTQGHWAPQRPGYRWEPRRWEHGPGGWHQRGGRWAR